MGCNLPADDLVGDHRITQAAAFSLLFESDKPATEMAISARSGLDLDDTNKRLAEVEERGMLRRDDNSHVIGIAGLTIVPTQHEITIGDTTRWTWCALDAIGIIGAIGRGGRFTTTVPGSDAQATLEFTTDSTTDSSAVVFMADGFADWPGTDNRCTTVNLFPTAEQAEAWAATAGVTGEPITVTNLMADATEMWTPLVEMIGPVPASPSHAKPSQPH